MNFKDYRYHLGEYLSEQIERVATPLGEEIVFDPHQVEANANSVSTIREGKDRFSIAHCCGSGKTVLAKNMLIASQRAKNAIDNLTGDERDIVMVTERTILNGVHEKLAGLGLDIGVWGSGKKQLDREIILVNIQTLQRHLAVLEKNISVNEVGMLLGDEADLYLTPKRREVVDTFEKALKVGYTATPEWRDKRNISSLWGKTISKYPLWKSIDDGMSTPPIFKLFQAETNGDWGKLKYGDYDQKSLNQAYMDAEIYKSIPKVYDTLVPEGKEKEYPTLVYVPSTDLVDETVREFRSNPKTSGLKISSWTGDTTTSKTIKKDSERMQRGELDILVLCQMGGRGMDIPRARCIIDAAPSLSKTHVEQRLARVLRIVREGTLSASGDFKKPFSIIAQVIPKSYPRTPVLLPDILFGSGEEPGRDYSQEGYKNKIIENNQDAISEIERLDNLEAARRDVTDKLLGSNVKLLSEIDIKERISGRAEIGDEEGCFLIDGEKYATGREWAETFDIDRSTLSRRIRGDENSNVKMKEGVVGNQIVSIYPEMYIRELSKDLLECQGLPKADSERYFDIDGEKWASAMKWSEVLGVHNTTINTRIKKDENLNVQKKEGVVRGKKFLIYSKSYIYELFNDILEYQKLPTSDANGYFEIDGEKWTSTKTFSTTFDLYRATIDQKIKNDNNSNVKRKEGVVGGQVVPIYPETYIRELCKDLFECQELPTSDAHGFFDIECAKWASINKWSEALGISVKSINTRIKKDENSNVQKKEGVVRGKKSLIYSESYILELCKDSLECQELLTPDSHGFFHIECAKWASTNKWSEALGIGRRSIDKKIKNDENSNAKMKEGLVRGTKSFIYPETYIRELCKDLLECQELPTSDAYGFFDIECAKWASINKWSEALGISMKLINKKIKKDENSNVQKKEGVVRGKKSLIYSESYVYELCKDLIAKKVA